MLTGTGQHNDSSHKQWLINVLLALPVICIRCQWGCQPAGLTTVIRKLASLSFSTLEGNRR